VAESGVAVTRSTNGPCSWQRQVGSSASAGQPPYRFDSRPGPLREISVIAIIKYGCRCRGADRPIVHQEHDVCSIVPYLHRAGDNCMQPTGERRSQSRGRGTSRTHCGELFPIDIPHATVPLGLVCTEIAPDSPRNSALSTGSCLRTSPISDRSQRAGTPSLSTDDGQLRALGVSKAGSSRRSRSRGSKGAKRKCRGAEHRPNAVPSRPIFQDPLSAASPRRAAESLLQLAHRISYDVVTGNPGERGQFRPAATPRT
jgi:hypothetical protein